MKLKLLIALLAVPLALRAQTPPATLPADSRAAWVLGYTAGAASTQPATQPTSQPATQPSPILPANWQTLPLLTTLMPAQTAGIVVSLNGGSYLVDGQVNITIPNLTIRGPGLIVCKVPAAASTAIGTTAAATGFVCADVDFCTTAPLATAGPEKVKRNAFRLYGANAHLKNCTFTDFDDAVFVGATASGTALDDLACFNMRGDSIYGAGAQNVTVNRLTCDGSTKEHVVRLEAAEDISSPTGPTLPGANSLGGWTFTDCVLANFNGKEIIAIRNADGRDPTGKPLGTLITGGTLTNPKYAGIRAGQTVGDGSAPPVSSAPCVTVRGVKFRGGASLVFQQGTTGWIADGNDFEWAGHPPIGLQGPHCSGTATGNMCRLAGRKYDGRLWVGFGMTPADVVTESGTVDETGAVLAVKK